MTGFSMAECKSSTKGRHIKVTGPIVVHEGNIVQMLNEKDGSQHLFKITDKTTIRCDMGFFHGNTVMNTSALVPALTVEVEGISGSLDTPEAKIIRVDPATFALIVGQDKQGGRSCLKPTEDAGRYHGIKTLLTSFLPPI
jgi:hypothetical protein